MQLGLQPVVMILGANSGCHATAAVASGATVVNPALMLLTPWSLGRQIPPTAAGPHGAAAEARAISADAASGGRGSRKLP